MLHKTNGRTKNSFEARFRTDKVYFYCRETKEERPADRATLNTKETKVEKSQQHSAPEPINIENTDFKSVSDGMETEHLESEGLFQIGDKKWEICYSSSYVK